MLDMKYYPLAPDPEPEPDPNPNPIPSILHEYYKPPPKQSPTPQSLSNPIPHRLTTPPPPSPITWPGIVLPSRNPSTTSTLGLRATLFSAETTYTEPLAWSHASTHFRSPSNTSTHLSSDEHAHMLSITPGTAQKQYFRNARHIRREWRTGWVGRMPWEGGGCLVLLMFLSASSTTLLFAAHHTSVTHWTTSPHVYLALLEALIGLLTLGAFAHGVVLAFWICLLRGTTVAEVCDVYGSMSILGALSRCVRWQGNKVCVASICSVLSLSRGPLAQRALVVVGDVYEVQVVYAVLGMVVSVVAVCAIIPLYAGYWELGRSVSLCPLEVARAFGAPLMDGVEGNVTGRDVEVEKGLLTVRYGAVERNGEEKVLRVEDTSRTNVRMPREGEIFG